MKIKGISCKCGNDDIFITPRGNNCGAYCVSCGSWLKWLNKNEKRLVQYHSGFTQIRREIK